MRKSLFITAFLAMVFTASAHARLADFLGNWKNVDANTRGVTKIQITQTRGVGMIKVKAWGKCHPTDCYWGEVTGHIYAPNAGANLSHNAIAATAIFKTSFSITVVVMRLQSRGMLRADVYTRFTDRSKRSNYTNTYHFRRGPVVGRKCPDLVVTKIYTPKWDHARRRSIIKVTIKNIGTLRAGMSIARIIDPSTAQPTGAPYNAIATVPPLNPGASHTVTFFLPYQVFNPDATLEVTADYKQMIKECKETNNSKKYHVIG